MQKISKFLMVLLISLCMSFSGYTQILEFLSGDSYNMEDLIQEGDMVVLFWTTWCPYCAKELKRLDLECGNLNFKLLAVNLREDKNKVLKFIESAGLSDCLKGKIAIDSLGSAGTNYGIVGLPTYVFLHNGAIIKRTNFLDIDEVNRIFNKGK